MNLTIQSPGLLDPLALQLMGVSSKRGDNSKIGRFGTGLKYALAYLLRNGHQVRLFIGLREVKIETKKVVFRDQTFNQILIDGKETSITIEMGPDWELWQAIRELYCNAMDEGEPEPCRGKDPHPNYTTFVIDKCESLQHTFTTFFPLKAPTIVDTEFGQLLQGAAGHFYKQRVFVAKAPDKFTFAYNIDSIKLTEDRKPTNLWDLETLACQILTQITSPEHMSLVVQAKEWANLSEYQLTALVPVQASHVFREYFNGRLWCSHTVAAHLESATRSRTVIVHENLARYLEAHSLGINAQNINRKADITPIEMTAHRKIMLDRAAKIMEANNFALAYPVVVCEFSTPAVRGRAKNQTIYLAERAFSQGAQYLLETLIEEQIHLKFSVQDETRDMQNTLLELLAQTWMRI